MQLSCPSEIRYSVKYFKTRGDAQWSFTFLTPVYQSREKQLFLKNLL